MNKGVIGIELGLLEQMLRDIVKTEMVEVREEIKQTIISKREELLEEERLYTDQVCELFRKKARKTISNYVRAGIIPQPQRDISDRPYWTPDQLKMALHLRGIKTKFSV